MENQDENLDHINQEEQNKTQQNQGNENSEDNQGPGIVPDEQIEGSDADTDKQVSSAEDMQDPDRENYRTEETDDE